MTYARAIRLSLAASRTRGLDFPSAWAIALEENPVPEVERHVGPYGADHLTGQGGSWNDVLPFLEKAMRDAYERRPFRRGQKPTLIVPLSERSDGVRGRYTRSERGRSSLERTPSHIA